MLEFLQSFVQNMNKDHPLCTRKDTFLPHPCLSAIGLSFPRSASTSIHKKRKKNADRQSHNKTYISVLGRFLTAEHIYPLAGNEWHSLCVRPLLYGMSYIRHIFHTQHGHKHTHNKYSVERTAKRVSTLSVEIINC